MLHHPSQRRAHPFGGTAALFLVQQGFAGRRDQRRQAVLQAALTDRVKAPDPVDLIAEILDPPCMRCVRRIHVEQIAAARALSLAFHQVDPLVTEPDQPVQQFIG